MFDLIKTKTFWLGISSIAAGVALMVAGDYPQGIPAILYGFGAIFGRDAIRKLQDPKATAAAKAIKEDLKIKKAEGKIAIKKAGLDARKKALSGSK